METRDHAQVVSQDERVMAALAHAGVIGRRLEEYLSKEGTNT